jgi:hypothetical protein
VLSEAVSTPAVEMSPAASVRTTTASCEGSASMIASYVIVKLDGSADPRSRRTSTLRDSIPSTDSWTTSEYVSPHAVPSTPVTVRCSSR